MLLPSFQQCQHRTAATAAAAAPVAARVHSASPKHSTGDTKYQTLVDPAVLARIPAGWPPVVAVAAALLLLLGCPLAADVSKQEVLCVLGTAACPAMVLLLLLLLQSCHGLGQSLCGGCGV